MKAMYKKGKTMRPKIVLKLVTYPPTSEIISSMPL